MQRPRRQAAEASLAAVLCYDGPPALRGVPMAATRRVVVLLLAILLLLLFLAVPGVSWADTLDDAARPETPPKKRYAAERAGPEAFGLIPLFDLPKACGLSSLVKNWMALRGGGWRMQEVWPGTSARAAAAGEAP